MSVAGSEAEDTIVNVHEEQVVRYMKKRKHDGTSNVSDLAGAPSPSKSQKEVVAQKLSAAAELLPLDIDDLHARLQAASNTPYTPPDPDRFRSGSPTPIPVDERLLPPNFIDDEERAIRRELIQDGGRPVCSLQELSDILADPTAKDESNIPWISGDPDPRYGIAGPKTLFQRQYDRWNEFCKSQLANRGLSDIELETKYLERETEYVEAYRRIYLSIGQHRTVSDSDFEPETRAEWQDLNVDRELPEGASFSDYNNAVKIRLAPYRLTPQLQLRKDPQKQTKWSDWLEYLSFELRYLEWWTRIAESREQTFFKSMKSARERQEAAKIGPSYMRAQNLVDLVDDILRDTERYVSARKSAFFQRQRVAWIIKEAGVIKSEMSLERNMAKSKKKKHGDDDEALESQSQSKKVARRDDDANADADPITISRTLRPRRNPLRKTRQ